MKYWEALNGMMLSPATNSVRSNMALAHEFARNGRTATSLVEKAKGCIRYSRVKLRAPTLGEID